MSDDKNTIDNIVHLTTPEFMYLLQRVDRLDEKFTSKIESLDEKLSNRIENLGLELKQENRAMRSLIVATLGLTIATISVAVAVAITLLK
jgi:hypothetical protein